MRKIKVALINNIHYCLFPEDIGNISDFIEYVNKNYHSFIKLESLIESGCVAPFFIEEDLKTEILYLNPSNYRQIKEAEVSVLRRFEYEEELKNIIQEKCVHCIHYSKDVCEEDYKSHIENINLNGECYGYQKKYE